MSLSRTKVEQQHMATCYDKIRSSGDRRSPSIVPFFGCGVLLTATSTSATAMDERLENFMTGTRYQPTGVIGEGAYGIVWSAIPDSSCAVLTASIDTAQQSTFRHSAKWPSSALRPSTTPCFVSGLFERSSFFAISDTKTSLQSLTFSNHRLWPNFAKFSWSRS